MHGLSFIVIKMSASEEENTNKSAENNKLGDFISETKEAKFEMSEIRPTDTTTKRREYKRNYQKEWRKRRSQELEELKTKQIKGAQICLLNINNKLRNISVQSEQEYIDFLDDLLATLRDNGLINDYSLTMNQLRD